MSGYPGISGYHGMSGNHPMSFDSDAADASTSTASLINTDPVRWLIDQQSFNGAWTLDEKDIEKLTNGKSLDAFKSKISEDKDVLTTALAMAVLELKHNDKKSLWYAIVEKGRKRLNSFGLTNDQVNLLINEMKNKL
jgi:hypothetical protein